MREAISADDNVDPCLLWQYEEQVGDVKSQQSDIHNIHLSLDETDELYTTQTALETEDF